MKKNRWFLRAVVLVLFCGLMTSTVSLAAEVGSSKDPLVTLSYLEEVFLDTILDLVDEKIEERNEDLADQLGGNSGSGEAATFTVVTLSNGQILTGDIGCEVMLRVGSAVCMAASNPGLIDETAATTLGNGQALEANHMYMMTIEDRGVMAASDTVKLLVRGGYYIA